MAAVSSGAGGDVAPEVRELLLEQVSFRKPAVEGRQFPELLSFSPPVLPQLKLESLTLPEM